MCERLDIDFGAGVRLPAKFELSAIFDATCQHTDSGEIHLHKMWDEVYDTHSGNKK